MGDPKDHSILSILVSKRLTSITEVYDKKKPYFVSKNLRIWGKTSLGTLNLACVALQPDREIQLLVQNEFGAWPDGKKIKLHGNADGLQEIIIDLVEIKKETGPVTVSIPMNKNSFSFEMPCEIYGKA